MPSRVDEQEESEDGLADEVKVFDGEDTEEEEQEQESYAAAQLLVEDKNDVTYQAEQPTASSGVAPAASTSKDPTGTTPHTAEASAPAKPLNANIGSSPQGKGAFSRPVPQNGSRFGDVMANQLFFQQQQQQAALLQLYPNLFTNPYSVPAISPLFSWPRPFDMAAAAAAAVKTNSPSFGTTAAHFSPSFELAAAAAAAAFPSMLAAASQQRFSPIVANGASPANLSPIHSPMVAGAHAMKHSPSLLPTSFQHLNLLGQAQQQQQQDYAKLHPLIQLQQCSIPNVGQNIASLASGFAQTSSSAATLQANGFRTQNTSLKSKSTSCTPVKVRHGQLGSSQAPHSVGGKGGHIKKDTPKTPHIKKPLNAFMIFMKENRQKLMEERGYKERQSAELNKELGRLWHTLTAEDQKEYYAKAKEAKQRHHELHPGWSARENYAINKTNKKKKRDKSAENLEAKKCRARFGLDQQGKWCKHCRRKKRCLWFKEDPPLQRPPSPDTTTSNCCARQLHLDLTPNSTLIPGTNSSKRGAEIGEDEEEENSICSSDDEGRTRTPMEAVASTT